MKISKWNKIIGIFKGLPAILLSTLLTIYKMFIRPHIDYADIICHKPNNK